MAKNIGLIFNILGLIATLVWLKFDSGWEPLAASILLIGTLAAQIYFGNKKNGEQISLKQKGGKSSNNYQSGRDTKINQGQITQSKKLEQNAGEGSTSLQAQTMTINQGISYNDAKNIALDVYTSNFTHLAEIAANTARERAEEFFDNFADEMQKRNPEAMNAMRTPAMQISLYEAQKEYAKSGDKDLAEVLIDILVDRAGIPEKNLVQIVLDESIKVVPKLTNSQLDTLTIAFLLRSARSTRAINLLEFNFYLEESIKPFVGSLSNEKSLFQHLEYCGCANVSIASSQLESNMRRIYKGLFSKGFTYEELKNHVSSDDNYRSYTIPCLHNPEKLQFRYMDDDTIKEELPKIGISTEQIQKIQTFFDQTTFSDVEVKNYLASRGDYMKKLFDIWRTSSLKSLNLTTVGIAIAQANFRRKTGETLDLGTWIKE